MRRRLPGLTLDGHRRIGGDLQRLREGLIAVADAVGHAYGARFCDEVLEIMRRVDRLRSRLEDRAAAENPDADLRGVYFGMPAPGGRS